MDFSLSFECNGKLFQVNENIRISTSYYAKYKLHSDLKYYSRNDQTIIHADQESGASKQLDFRMIPWRRKRQPTPVFLPGKSMDRGAWWAIVYGVTELDMAEQLNNSKVTVIILESRQIVKVKVIDSQYYTGVLFYSFVYRSCAGSLLLLAGCLQLHRAEATLQSLLLVRDFSWRWLLSLWSTGYGAWAQYLSHTGLVAPQHEESSQIGGRNHVPCIGRWIL